MKKSEIYHLAQIAVVQSPNIAPEAKLQILRELFCKESMEMFCEEQEAKEVSTNGESV